uniref:Ubiquitin-like domain-containing protein n=1 Tax=Trichuris muris TaxID=70415 RepID=A0A5S6QLM5_TRIMR
MKRQTEPVEASTSETKRCRSRNRARQSKPTSEVHHETVDVSSSLDEVENKFSTIAVYGFHGSKCHFFTFNVPRNEPLNSLRNQISTGLNASIRGLRFRLHGELVSGQESLEQLGVGKTECLEFEIDDLLIDLKFVAPEQDKVALSVNQTDRFEAIFSRLADIYGTKSSQLTLFYDGERVRESDTPSSLDMENGDALDVVIKK